MTKWLWVIFLGIAVAACGGGGGSGGGNTAAAISATATTTAQSLNVGTSMASFSPLTPSGGATPYTYSYTGTLPIGLSFNTSTGVVSGTPTAAYTTADLVFSVKDANNVVASTTSTVSFTVGAAVLNIAGSWSGSTNNYYRGGTDTFDLTLSQSGSSVSGNGGIYTDNTYGLGFCYSINSINASVSGTTFSGVMNATYLTCTITMNFTSNVTGTQMSGTYTSSSLCGGSFSSGGTFTLNKQ